MRWRRPSTATGPISQLRRSADLEPWNIEAKSPDAFVLDQIHISLQAVAASIRQIADSRTSPPESVEDILTQLERDGLVESTVALRAA